MSWVAMSMAASSLAKRWASTFFPADQDQRRVHRQKQPGAATSAPHAYSVIVNAPFEHVNGPVRSERRWWLFFRW